MLYQCMRQAKCFLVDIAIICAIEKFYVGSLSKAVMYILKINIGKIIIGKIW